MPYRRMSWESLIDDSLKCLSDFLKEDDWFGRENEIINLYAHRFLLAKLIQGPLIDPAQIGIEVAVRQIPKASGKKLVRKDLIIWNHPLETVWENGVVLNSPAVILEWKTDKITKCDQNIDWLKAYTKFYPEVLGYSICAFVRANRGIWYRKITEGYARKPVCS